MISSIRNPWVRRSLVVIAAVPFAVIMLLVESLMSIESTARDLRAAWKGRRIHVRKL